MYTSIRIIALFLITVFFVCSTCGCAFMVRGFSKGTPEAVAEQHDGMAKNESAGHYNYVNNPYEGSLWSPYRSRSFLFEDNKARNINDILTVQIAEVTDASRNATTSLARKGGMKSNITKFFGSPLDFGMENLWGKKTGVDKASQRVEQPFAPEIETDSENTYDGSGSTLRKDKFIATIAAKVMDVYPNGNMFIKGKREVTINNEKQYIQLSGIVRPEDISPDNVVISSSVADAKISVSGKGVIADKQSPGIGHRIFDFIWPF